MRRVLMVQYYFPPLGGIGSVRAARFAAWLPDFGWAPTVLAARKGSYFLDPGLRTGSACVVRAFAPDLSRAGKRIVLGGKATAAPARVGRGGAWIRDRVRAWVYRPDAQIAWYPFALSAGRSILREQRFDAVYSSSFPITSHLIARRLAREARLPWIAEFRDPWADVKGEEGARAIADRLERGLLAAADAVVTVSPTLESLWRGKGARRTLVITNGFDSVDPASAAPEDFVVTHAGSYYPDFQDLGGLWPALRAVRDAEPGRRLRVRLIGDPPKALRDAIAAEGLAHDLEVTGFVAHDTALPMMARSSVLVVAGTSRRHRVHDGILPAKMFEYLATGRPVLYVGEADTDAARLLAAQPGCWIVPTGNPAAALAALHAIRRAPGHFVRDIARFSARELARTLGGLLDAVTTDPPARTRSA